VKTSIVTLILLVSSAMPQGRPASVGQIELRKYEATHPLDVPPQPPPAHRIDTVQLQREANELSSLAQSIPTDINSIAKGTLPKDALAILCATCNTLDEARVYLGARLEIRVA
jgi:hypothetical protein